MRIPDTTLTQTLTAVSPRFAPPPTPLRSKLIYGSVLALWVVLFARSFFLDGVFAWSTGIVYVSYDTVLLLFVFWQTLGLFRRPVPLPPPARAISVGVLVAAHNEAAVLPITLEALFAQTDPADQILIADDGSTDATPEVLARLYGLAAPAVGAVSAPSPTHPSLRWFRLPHGGKAVALNAALTRIDTEMMMTVDADTLLDPAAVGAMRRAFAASPGLVAATGVMTPVCSNSLSGRFFQWFQTYEYIRNFLSRYAWARLDCLLLISGAFAAFRRAPVVEVGGFDPDCLVEDYELIHRLRRHGTLHGRGWTTQVVGAARSRTDAPGTIGAFLRQRRRWFGGFLQTQYWYRDMIGDSRYGWLGVAMLPVKAIDTLQPIYGLVAFALLLFYLVTGRFGLVNPVAGVIGAKIGLDLAFYLWSLVLYHRWAGGQSRVNLFYAIIAAIAEPFSFQLLRHTGAAWGWVSFLTGQRTWSSQRRFGLVAAPAGQRGSS
jgi:cellulose synthase/poly-beta-1,6-N-acetylglucosamine synthase-like glycosyltransferase